MKKTAELSCDKLEDLWDNGFENNNLDPGNIFNKAMDYCRELESKITKHESQSPAITRGVLEEKLIRIIDKHITEFSNKIKIYINSRLAKLDLRDDLISLISELSAPRPDQEKDKWISVKEELPSVKHAYYSDNVLGVYKDGSVGIVHYDYSEKGWQNWQNPNCLIITHWMPLPAKPNSK